MRLTCLLTALLLTTGCASGLTRDAQCLASLTPDYLDAQTEMARLEDAWRDALGRSEHARGTVLWAGEGKAVPAMPPVGWRATASSTSHQRVRGLQGEASPPIIETAQDRYLAARQRMVRMRDWYDRVYRRVQMRMEERLILSESFMVLAGGGLGALVFYPVVWWNVHNVFWDGIDPDHEADPVTRFCGERLRQEPGRLGGAMSRQGAAPPDLLRAETRGPSP